MGWLRHCYVVRSFGRLGSREGGVSRVERVSYGYCFRSVRRGCIGFQEGMDAWAAIGEVAELGLYISGEVT
jgi:hypothetical protein